MAPTFAQINRAANLYMAGASQDDFIEIFAQDGIDVDTLVLLWHAGKTAALIGEREYPVEEEEVIIFRKNWEDLPIA